jgi:hypothetical protein
MRNQTQNTQGGNKMKKEFRKFGKGIESVQPLVDFLKTKNKAELMEIIRGFGFVNPSVYKIMSKWKKESLIQLLVHYKANQIDKMNYTKFEYNGDIKKFWKQLNVKY